VTEFSENRGRKVAAETPMTNIGILIGVAVLFGLCGALSSSLYSQLSFKNYLPGVPFALLCTLLMARSGKAALVLPAVILAWPIAQFAAIGLAMATGGDDWPMGAAGLLGATIVAAAIGIAHPRVLSPWRLAGLAALGFLAGLSFGPWLTSYRLHLNTAPDPCSPSS
jgi:hypothetical protein